MVTASRSCTASGTVGDDCELRQGDEVVPEVPMALVRRRRGKVPHRVIGSSIADQTLDLQDLKTGILRSVMDSLAEALDPKMAVVEGQVNLDDVANNGARRHHPDEDAGRGADAEPAPSSAPRAMGVLAYVDEVKAQRTGITRASRGLDPEALQSATKVAGWLNTIEASQERVEMIARTWRRPWSSRCSAACCGRLARHQDRPRMVRLRGRWWRSIRGSGTRRWMSRSMSRSAAARTASAWPS